LIEDVDELMQRLIDSWSSIQRTLLIMRLINSHWSWGHELGPVDSYIYFDYNVLLLHYIVNPCFFTPKINLLPLLKIRASDRETDRQTQTYMTDVLHWVRYYYFRFS